MISQSKQHLEAVRQQFERSPYPRISLEETPKDNSSYLYQHHFASAYYHRNQQVIDPKDKLILDAGCGSGYKALALAYANPGAKIVGIDFSEESVKLARTRLEYHGIENVEFHAMAIESIASLGMEFDYINCDEVLYLLPDPEAGLRALKSVLKPQGIIRGNLHSALQRVNFFRAQKLFKMMGLMEDDVTDEMAMELSQETMEALRDSVDLKKKVWNSRIKGNPEGLLANYLLREDRGYTIPDLFELLGKTDLEFISMVNWRQWNPFDLFVEEDKLPAFLGMSLPATSIEERLHLYELLNPIHRLLDFWVGHPGGGCEWQPPEEWDSQTWNLAQVHLHPLLQTDSTRRELETCLQHYRAFTISQQLAIPGVGKVMIDGTTAGCLLPLFQSPQSFSNLTGFFRELRPRNPVTAEATSDEEAFAAVRGLLQSLESLSFVFLSLDPSLAKA
ncbi:MAG: class I SAM-dependent methyltransferase [Phormidium sp. BM_Day4_Bin.17]|nr:class I SAM-dependent methyltransferase [Phormidium sp. BM_Day4_Bin.17]UCJ12028.1 MAG: methyltransferase domain-containing protein [Phormidium sp. PBR-2020]